MSIERKDADGLTPTEIESMGQDEITEELTDVDSEQGLIANFKKILKEIALGPDLYYLEESNGGVAVRKKSDGTVAYFTDVPFEVDALKGADDLGRV